MRPSPAAWLALPALLLGAAPARARPAGNAVTWHSAPTEDCVVHWHDGAERTASRTSEECDDTWARVTGAAGHRPDGPIHVVVRDLEARADGLALPESRHVTVWATPLYSRLRGRLDWRRVALAHEMAHVVAADLADPLHGEVAATALHRSGDRNADAGGRAVIDGLGAPLWWIEGSAEYWTELAGLSRWTTSRNMLLRAAVLESNLLDWDEWTERDGRHALGSELGYAQGHSFGRYLRERLSDRAMSALGRAHRGGPGVAPSWERAYAEVLGAPGERVFTDWLARARAAYGDQVAALGPEVAGSFVALSPRDVPPGAADPRAPTDRRAVWEDAAEDTRLSAGRWDRWTRRRRLARRDAVFLDNLRFSPDDRWLGYTDRDGTVLLPLPLASLPPRSGRWLDDAAWQAVRGRELRLAALHGFSFAPDGSRAVVASESCLRARLGCLGPDAASAPDLFLVELETGATARLTSGLRAVDPAWSPDGREIAFVRRADGEAWLGRLDPEDPDAGVTWLLKRTDGTQVERPRWSPDGRRLVFSLARGERQDLWTVGRGGGDLRPLTWDAAEDRDPEYAPDGRSVVFSSDRTGVFDVYRLELETGRVERLTNVWGGAFSPTLTPDGDLLYLYFTSFGFKPYYLRRPVALETGEVSLPDPLELARGEAWRSPEPKPAEPEGGILAGLGRRLVRPEVVPALVVDGSRASAGALVDAADAPGVVTLSGLALLGESALLRARIDVGLVPSPFLEARWLRSAEHFGLGLDADEDPLTLAPQHALGVKATSRWAELRAGLGLSLGERIRLEAWGEASEAAVLFASGGEEAEPLHDRYGVAWALRLGTADERDREGDVDPRGLALYLEHGLYATDLPEARWDAVELIGRPPAAGGGFDYAYQRAVLDLVGGIPLPAPAGLRHTLELGLHAGWISRNVSAAEELFAGGLHPLHLFRPDYAVAALPGYEDYAAHGETLVVARASWRLPLLRDLHLRAGPLYVSALWLQLGGSAGNAWGYDADWLATPQGTVETHRWAGEVPPALRGRPRAAPGSIRRERPMLDVARNNGNRLLYEAGAELRFDLSLLGRPWGSRVRLSYGFSTLRGLGDVNDDGVLADHYPHDPFVDEVAPPSLHAVIAVGTGLR